MRKVQLELDKFFADISGKKTEEAVYAVANEVLNLSATYTPVDTALLINSRKGPVIESKSESVTGTVGYTADYAAFVHDKSGVLKGKPRASGKGSYWDPNAKPKFLESAGDEVAATADDILERFYRV